ncbi:hypothetical protein B0H17DRAFT_1181491 [Mycena rosella]|uniref:Uncharacterized protein n=1 Tax=Mycena rosella TaxID=1033263 RepID=A0AAD7DBU1_MYCRO|nr:hypothetical protein B0H17DRAFT_1181491 [Mycena rosella]
MPVPRVIQPKSSASFGRRRLKPYFRNFDGWIHVSVINLAGKALRERCGAVFGTERDRVGYIIASSCLLPSRSTHPNPSRITGYLWSMMSSCHNLVLQVAPNGLATMPLVWPHSGETCRTKSNANSITPDIQCPFTEGHTFWGFDVPVRMRLRSLQRVVKFGNLRPTARKALIRLERMLRATPGHSGGMDPDNSRWARIASLMTCQVWMCYGLPVKMKYGCGLDKAELAEDGVAVLLHVSGLATPAATCY